MRSFHQQFRFLKPTFKNKTINNMTNSFMNSRNIKTNITNMISNDRMYFLLNCQSLFKLTKFFLPNIIYDHSSFEKFPFNFTSYALSKLSELK